MDVLVRAEDCCGMRAGMAMSVAGITRGARMIGQRVRTVAVMHDVFHTCGAPLIGSGVRAGVDMGVRCRKRGGLARAGWSVRNGLFSAAVGVKVCRAVRLISGFWRKLGGVDSVCRNLGRLVKV